MAGSGGWQGMIQKSAQSEMKKGGGGDDKDSGGSRYKKAMSSAGKAMADYGHIEAENAGRMGSSVGNVQYHKGGKVRKTGRAIVKRDERVIPAGKRKKVERLMKHNGMSLTNKKRGKKRKSKERNSSGR